MCNSINTHTHTHTHTHITWRGGHADARLRRRQATWRKVRRKDRAHTSQVIYPSNAWASFRSVRRRLGVLGLAVQVFNVNRHRSNRLACNHSRKETSPIRRPKAMYSSSACYAHVKRSTRVPLPSVVAHQREVRPGEGSSLLDKLGGPLQKTHRSNRYGVCHKCGEVYINLSRQSRG